MNALAQLGVLALAASPPRLLKPVSLHAVTASGVVIDFETDSTLSADVELSCGASKSSGRDRPSVHHTLPLRIPPEENSPPGACTYRVVSGHALLASGAFRLAPGQDEHRPFTFAVVGDTRDHARWAEVAHAILGKHPDFLVTTGDASDHPDDAKAWRDYYAAAADLFATTPVFAVPGNHDVGALFGPYNPAPETGLGPGTYAFTYGNAGFLALDSNHPDSPDQRAFASRALLALSGGPLFAFHHVPLYSCGRHRSSDEMRELFQPLFERARVSIDCAGHDHDLIVWKPVRGVRYVVSGGGGATLYDLANCEGPFAYEGFGFLLVAVRGPEIRLTAFDSAGTELYRSEPFQSAGPAVPRVDLSAILPDSSTGRVDSGTRLR